jgi:hypothetical protein
MLPASVFLCCREIVVKLTAEFRDFPRIAWVNYRGSEVMAGLNCTVGHLRSLLTAMFILLWICVNP